MATYSITLTRLSQTAGSVGTLQGFRFQVAASGGTPFTDNAIFRYLRQPPKVAGGPYLDVFYGVCSPVELAQVPVNNPGVNDDPPYLRLANLDLVFATQAEAEATWQAIQMDVANLCTSLGVMSVLNITQVVPIGG